ncbi:MAG: hypothetical protein Pg6C_11800 [Treponemataceae bacterium]|nr:MAG: hypothetical protein Pg6C_11800 [Treponemataceae bacterium]
MCWELAVALVFGLAGCGTILKAKNLSVTSESGKPDNIQIETKNASGNVVEIYAGTLPAQIKMPKAPKGSELIIHYTGKDGKPATQTLKRSFNRWALLDIVFVSGPMVIDWLTGNLFVYSPSKVTLPIAYRPSPEAELVLVEGIPEYLAGSLTLIGNIND